MSHVADVQMQIKDLDALKTVCAEQGVQFVEGQRTHKWYGRFVNDWSSDQAAANRRDPKTFGKCEHAIKVPGVDYEIGVVTRSDGEGFDLVYDSWGPGAGLERKFGTGLTRMKQQYSAEVTRRELSRKGYRVTTITETDGTVRVRAVGRN